MLQYQLLCNEKINKKPLVLFNTLFKVVKHETDIKGYWLDKGILYIDNIEAVKYPIIDNCYFRNAIKVLFLMGEKCIFYKDIYNQGVLEYPDGTWQILKTRKEIIYACRPCEKDIKLLLKKYDGLTVYKIDNGNYLLEIYS